MTTETNLQKEIYKPVKGYEGIYEISNLGNVKSLSRLVKRGNKKILSKEIILSSCLAKGYEIVNLSKDRKQRTASIHRLLAIHFIPNPENKKEVNHKNGIKTDNRIENLEWVTPSENTQHAYDTGLIDRKGSSHHMTTITEKQAIKIKNEHKINKCTQKYLAEKYKVSMDVIYNIVSGRSWSHI